MLGEGEGLVFPRPLRNRLWRLTPCTRIARALHENQLAGGTGGTDAVNSGLVLTRISARGPI